MGPRSARCRRSATLTWIGHATLLVQVDGLTILTDPQWSDRAGPTSWIGPRRLSPPGLPFESLPRVDVVVISHDHYDHLDLPTVRRLAATHDPLFLVPLGLKAWFQDNGMTHVEELDWWQEHEQRGVRFVCVPAQHFSQRSLWDASRRLWASWVIAGRERRLYFGGDTGYFDGFKEAGRRLGPFDVAALAIGAYSPGRDHEGGPHHAGGSGPGLRRSRRARDARHPLGHLRPGRGAARRAPGAHAGRLRAAGARLGPGLRSPGSGRRGPGERREAMAHRVLIVEDEPDIRDLLVFHLEREGYQVVQSRSGPEALRLARATPPDLVLLDLMLPEMDGLEVCRRLRQDPATMALPIVMLTARGDEVDRVLGLELGADDYVVKPFSPRELVARIRAVLRRTRPPAGAAPLVIGGLAIDAAAHQVTVDGAAVSLTRKEFDLLRALAEARGRVLSREYLLDHVWGYTAAGEIESRTVDVHVRRLRQKLGAEGQRIGTVTGVGYRFEGDR